MSRSLGDQMAHTLGCSDIPEIKKHCLEHEDNQIVIASDGVWEVMENNDVLKLIGDDPRQSAIKIVEESTK